MSNRAEYVDKYINIFLSFSETKFSLVTTLVSLLFFLEIKFSLKCCIFLCTNCMQIQSMIKLNQCRYESKLILMLCFKVITFIHSFLSLSLFWVEGSTHLHTNYPRLEREREREREREEDNNLLAYLDKSTGIQSINLCLAFPLSIYTYIHIYLFFFSLSIYHSNSST